MAPYYKKKFSQGRSRKLTIVKKLKDEKWSRNLKRLDDRYMRYIVNEYYIFGMYFSLNYDM